MIKLSSFFMIRQGEDAEEVEKGLVVPLIEPVERSAPWHFYVVFVLVFAYFVTLLVFTFQTSLVGLYLWTGFCVGVLPLLGCYCTYGL